MKKIILLISLALLSASAAFSQTVYKVCGTSDDLDIHNLQAATYNVTSLTADSFVFTAMNQSYTAKKVPNANYYFFNGGDQHSNFYIYPVNDKSFFVIPYDTIIALINSVGYNEWRYYHTDQSVGRETNENKRCALDLIGKDTDAIIANVRQELEAGAKVNEARSKVVVTDFFKNYQSKRNDPALNKDILNWWQRALPDTAASFPILQIKILTPSWAILRNEYGIVTGKTISAMYAYKSKKDNACYVEWQSFKYESLGGGIFDTELKNWSHGLDSSHLDFIEIPEGRRMVSSQWYYADCAALPSVPLR